MHRGGDRRQEGLAAGPARSLGDFHPWREPPDRGPCPPPSAGWGGYVLLRVARHAPRQGFDSPLTRAIADAVPVPVIASGGVGTLDHLVEGIRGGHATAVLAASLFPFG